MDERVIEICCGNQIEQWRSRDLAMGFYLEGAMACDGSESERYMNIYSQLMHGSYECCDTDSETFLLCKIAKFYRKFPNGTPIRDLYGKIEFPLPAY